MKSKTIAIGGVTAGLLLAGWGVLAQVEPPSAPQPASAVEAMASGQPVSGLLSTADAVDFWQARVDASPAGYLDRTQLGLALAAAARESADLEGYEASERVLREALEIDPTHTAARLGLAQALHSQHRFAEAEALASEVRSADPGSLGALALLGDTSFELGRYDVARSYYEQLAEQERSAPVVSRLSRLAFATGDSAGSIALAEEALELSERLDQRPSDRAFAWFQLGHVRFATGDSAGSIEALERALEIAPDHPGATEKLASVYASVGRTSEAEELYIALLASGPAADLHGSYADLLRARGETAAADEQERLGLALAEETIGRFPAERRHLVGFYLTRDPAVAVRLAEEDLAERQDIGAYDTLAWALFNDGQIERARELLGPMLATGAQDAELRYHAGAIAAAAGEVEVARDHLEAALAINDRFDPTEAADAAELLDSLG
ncbi:MAG: tetratricopeptide repeat protein [Ilumatobacter sp.]|uniref:tetratricopeptide repeat protein n=1 Tax=Ilumatobacter sp. TaxID=1967498 RepID=UPI00260DF25A|nr:tetratricopeptide repeat protein [Ilumatobacter sp.]MDJ0771304.1 tetratricopeptide repeat protein [Ilumatobacter sp.]